jgi:CBS domain containing-hemolysin-like protein
MLLQLFGNLVFILLVVLANAFFVAAGFAIVKVRTSQLRTDQERPPACGAGKTYLG